MKIAWLATIVLLLASSAAAQNGHGVLFSYTQSVSPGVTGNNIYRATNVSGPWTQIGSSTPENTSYLDQTGTVGTTYFYAATAVVSGQESAKAIDTTGIIYPPQPPSGLGVQPE